MADPQVLYAVSAVVWLGLISWVALVLLRCEPLSQGTEAMKSSPKALHAVGAEKPGQTQAPESSPQKDVRAATPAGGRASESVLPKLHSVDRPEKDSSLRLPVALDAADDDAPTGPLPLILVTAVARTDPGLKRAHNEDAYAILEGHHLFVIADGMGRHAAGEVASQLCVDTISEAFRTSDFGPPRSPVWPRRASRLRGAIWLANERIYREAQGSGAYMGMGTTVVCAYFTPNNQSVCIAHVGDSRCYRLREGELSLLTTDHTLGNAGLRGRTSGLLSRAVGIEPDVEVDFINEAPLPGDVYLLCSDGLSRMVDEGEIRSTLESAASLDEATHQLIEKAKEGGGRDNITTILVRVDALKAPHSSEG